MVTDDSVNNVDSLSQRCLRYRYKIGNSSAFVAQGDGNGQKAEKNETIAASAKKGSARRYGTDVDAEERLRLKNMTRPPPRKEDRQSLLTRPNAAVHEKDDETAQPLLCHVKYKKPEGAQIPNYEVKWTRILARKKTSKIESSKKRRYPVVVMGGWRPDRFSGYKKRLSCHGRFWNRIATNCQWYRCRSREEAYVPNSVEVVECNRSVGISAQQFSEDEDPVNQDENDDVSALEKLPAKVTTADYDNREISSGHPVHGQEMQTISEEDLVLLDDGDETINGRVLRCANDSEGACRIVDREPEIHLRTLNVHKKFLRSPKRCTRRKCSRCSQLHSDRYNCGIQSVVTDYFKSQIFTTRPKRICRKTQPRAQDIRYPHSCKVSLDAFRLPKRSRTTQSSIMWKVAAAIYEISGILKDGIVKLLPQNQVSERSPSAFESCSREDGCKDNRNVSTSVEGPVSCVNCTRRTEKCVANCKISTGSCSHRSDEKGEFEKACEEDPQNVVGAGWAAWGRKNTFASKRTFGSSISSLSSSSSFGYSCSATDDKCVAKNTENHATQESQDYRCASATELTVGLTKSKENSTHSATTVRVNRSTSQNEGFESYNEMDARSCINRSQLTDVEDMSGDEHVFSSPSWVLVEPEKDSEMFPGLTGRAKYSNSNRRRQLVRERMRKKSCLRNRSGYREGVIFYSSNESSEADSATSSNGGYGIRPRRKLELSARMRQNSSRLSCQENFSRRNCTGKKITSKTDCKSEQPYETLVQSYLEYFKEVELDEVPLEPALTAPPYCSKIPRLVRHGFVAGHVPMVSNVSRYKCCACGGEPELLAERTDTNDLHRRTRISPSRGPSRNVVSTSHHFYV